MKKQTAGVKLAVRSGRTGIFRVGGVTVIRPTATVTKTITKDGQEVRVMFAHSKLLRFETAQMIGKIIAKPITDEQRAKAVRLASKAKTAQNSSVTARFRNQSAA